MPSSGYAHVFWQIPVDCCCRTRRSLVGTLPSIWVNSNLMFILFQLSFSSSDADGGRTGGPEIGGALVSTLNGPSDRHSSLKVHVAPSFVFRAKLSGTAVAKWFVPSEHTTLAPRAASVCEIASDAGLSMSECRSTERFHAS
eukprot:496926-Prymnesium_polylepis.6